MLIFGIDTPQRQRSLSTPPTSADYAPASRIAEFEKLRSSSSIATSGPPPLGVQSPSPADTLRSIAGLAQLDPAAPPSGSSTPPGPADLDAAIQSRLRDIERLLADARKYPARQHRSRSPSPCPAPVWPVRQSVPTPLAAQAFSYRDALLAQKVHPDRIERRLIPLRRPRNPTAVRAPAQRAAGPPPIPYHSRPQGSPSPASPLASAIAADQVSTLSRKQLVDILRDALNPLPLTGGAPHRPNHGQGKRRAYRGRQRPTAVLPHAYLGDHYAPTGLHPTQRSLPPQDHVFASYRTQPSRGSGQRGRRDRA
jgi:hypothetical protein